MRRAALLLAGLMLAGCDDLGNQTLPDGVSAQDVALFKSAVTAEGCEVTSDAQAGSVRAATGFESEKLRLITQYLTLAGESQRLETGFRLTSGSCANA